MRIKLFISGMTSVLAASVPGINWADVKLGEAEIECERAIEAVELRVAIESVGLALSEIVHERRALPIRDEA